MLRVFVGKNGKYGYKDEDGILVIPCVFDKAMPFRESFAPVVYNNEAGYISIGGNFIKEEEKPVVNCIVNSIIKNTKFDFNKISSNRLPDIVECVEVMLYRKTIDEIQDLPKGSFTQNKVEELMKRYDNAKKTLNSKIKTNDKEIVK